VEKWCAESDRIPPSLTDLLYLQDSDPYDDIVEQFRREEHAARVAEGLSEEDSADEFELSEDEDSTTEEDAHYVTFFERVHRGRLRLRDPPASSRGGLSGLSIDSKSYGETKGRGVHGGKVAHGGMQECGNSSDGEHRLYLEGYGCM
jgi:hypothetical protein